VILLEQKGLIRCEMDTSDDRRQLLSIYEGRGPKAVQAIHTDASRAGTIHVVLLISCRNQLDSLLDKLNRHVASLARQHDL